MYWYGPQGRKWEGDSNMSASAGSGVHHSEGTATENNGVRGQHREKEFQTGGGILKQKCGGRVPTGT